MTVEQAYRILRNAHRNCGRGRGFTARGYDEARPVLEAFWDEVGTAVYVTPQMVKEYDKRREVR